MYHLGWAGKRMRIISVWGRGRGVRRCSKVEGMNRSVRKQGCALSLWVNAVRIVWGALVRATPTPSAHQLGTHPQPGTHPHWGHTLPCLHKVFHNPACFAVLLKKRCKNHNLATKTRKGGLPTQAVSPRWRPLIVLVHEFVSRTLFPPLRVCLKHPPAGA